MKLHHWFHLYADGEWGAPVTEHVAALRAAGLRFATVHVGIVGEDWQARMAAGMWITTHWPEAMIVVDAVDGWEIATLQHLADHLDALDPGDWVLYAHTKGAANTGVLNDVWREGMTDVLISRWRDCAAQIDDRTELATVHWLRPELQTDPNFGDRPYPGGNYWWGRVDFLATLPNPIPRTSRYEAEAWVGSGPRRPRVLNLDARHPWHAYAFRARQRLRARA